MMESYYVKMVFSFSLACLILLAGCKRKPGRDDMSREDSVLMDSAEIAQSKEVLSHRTLGLAYLEDNDLEAAESEFRKLIELAPGEALGYANMGIVYMRMGRYAEAEIQLRKAVEINPDDPDIRLNLAKVLDLMDKEEASREELEKTIEIDPEHVQSLYSLAESYQNLSDAYSVSQWEKYLRKIVETAPSNTVARLYLVEALIRNERSEEALENLEEIERIAPMYPGEAMEYYRQAIIQLQSGNLVEALTSVRIFHNLIKLTNNYQTDIQKLKGSTASRVGIPVISFSEARPAFLMEGESLLDVIQFTDVTSSAGLDQLATLLYFRDRNAEIPIYISSGDMDRDGDEDIFVSGYNADKGQPVHYLLMNEMGRFKDITEQAGIRHQGIDHESIFIDYNNDGFLDLYVTGEGSNRLYENVSEGQFENVSEITGSGDKGLGNQVMFFDLDQEGDLDIFLGNQNTSKVYRNNGDNTFTDITGNIAFGNENLGCRDAIFGDLDDDGDVDVLLVDGNGILRTYINMRDGNFSDATESNGLGKIEGSNRVASGDYNNDGYEDLFIVRDQGNPLLFLNKGDGTFSQDPGSESLFSSLPSVKGHDAVFFDFDNDGFLDILYSGESATEGGRGVFLFHNEGPGKFKDVSSLLPADLKTGSRIVVNDYNEDGDLDIWIAVPAGGVRLLRNDGGNANHHLKVQLVGIKTGSSKNNHFGIGAKVEVRAGELYQMKTVTTPNIHFGLGSRDKVDVVRILWTNGVPQNIFSPGSDQDLIEEQELKGSCPFLYVWDGQDYTFLKDMMWRSALGMPMGIMGGNRSYAFSNASEEYLKIPGESLKALDHSYRLRITAELWETIYVDEIQLYTLDHPSGEQVYVDEKFTGPPFPEFSAYHIREEKLPLSVTDGSGMDLLPQISQKDNQYISNFIHERYQGMTIMHDLFIEFDKSDAGKNLLLFLNGWIFPTDASINLAISQSHRHKIKAPFLQVLNTSGEWETVIEEIGFPAGKDKTVVVDLTGKVPGSSIPVVRIRTNMEIYWDHIFYSTEFRENTSFSYRLEPVSADLHYRGFSTMFRKGGHDGPFWFDYNQVTTGPKWRDLEGYYTRYGGVQDLIEESDNQYVIMNAGDELSIAFDDRNLPDLPPGWERDFIIFSVGWVKDGDLNTATGNQVEPYPYHGMIGYPEGRRGQDGLPGGMKQFLEKYNTREVTHSTFKNQIRNYDQ